MNMYRLWLVALLALLLNACATPLQPDNYQERVSAKRLDLHRFVVGGSGSGAADDASIDLTLLRSAEIALQHGYPWFVIVDPESLGDSETDQPTSEYAGHRYRHTGPGTSNTIICFANKPPGDAYVALFVKASLRARYQLDQAGTTN